MSSAAHVVLTCDAGGCDVRYTYLAAPHEKATQDTRIADVHAARAAAGAWGWTSGGEPDQFDDRCPRHPSDEYLLDGGD